MDRYQRQTQESIIFRYVRDIRQIHEYSKKVAEYYDEKQIEYSKKMGDYCRCGLRDIKKEEIECTCSSCENWGGCGGSSSARPKESGMSSIGIRGYRMICRRCNLELKR